MGEYEMDYEWAQNDNGNWVYRRYGVRIATVFSREGSLLGRWKAILDDPEDPHKPVLLSCRASDGHTELMELVEAHYAGKGDSAHWERLNKGWKRSKKGSLYRRVGAATYSIKQARSGSYYIASQNGLFANQWFGSEEEAQKAVDAYRQAAAW